MCALSCLNVPRCNIIALFDKKCALVAEVSDEDEEGNTWPVIQIKKGKETFEIEVSMDPEGNGPGFLFGLPEPK